MNPESPRAESAEEGSRDCPGRGDGEEEEVFSYQGSPQNSDPVSQGQQPGDEGSATVGADLQGQPPRGVGWSRPRGHRGPMQEASPAEEEGPLVPGK